MSVEHEILNKNPFNVSWMLKWGRAASVVCVLCKQFLKMTVPSLFNSYNYLSPRASRDWLETRELHASQCSADGELKTGDEPGACSS